jgi:hypothetical protein
MPNASEPIELRSFISALRAAYPVITIDFDDLTAHSFEPAMGGKWLGVLKEATPNLSRVAMLLVLRSHQRIPKSS